MRRLTLVDGLKSEQRDHVWRVLVSQRIGTDFSDVCDINTPPHMYAQYMGYVLDDINSVRLQSSWIMHRVTYRATTDPSLKPWLRNNLMKYRMLDRMALGSNVVLHYVPVNWSEFWDYAVKQHGRAAEVVRPAIEALHKISYDPDPLKAPYSGFAGPINEGPGIGAFKAGNILIIGDRHGRTLQPYRMHRNLAFCSMSGVGCSEWLAQLLEDANISEWDLYWVNAYYENGKATNPTFLDKLKPSTIFALGDAAQKWCRTYNLKHEAFHHPQYWKRFHAKEPYPFVDALNKAVYNLNRA